jgi:hypothetical protein
MSEFFLSPLSSDEQILLEYITKQNFDILDYSNEEISFKLTMRSLIAKTGKS